MKKQQEAAAKIQAEVDAIARREQRAAMREKRAKDQAKEQLRSEIRRVLIDKSTTFSPAATAELLEVHGCFERGKQFVGAIGGMVMQWYHVLNAIWKIYPEESLLTFYARMQEDPGQESVKSAQTPREILMEFFFVPFILTALKELKCEFMQFLIMPEMAEVMQTLKVSKPAGVEHYDFTRLNNEQYMVFRNAFVTNRMFSDVYKVEDNPRLMDQILGVLCMVICNRVPKNIVPFKCDTLVQKVRLVSAPRGMELKDRVTVDANGEETKIEKNTNVRAIVRILVPKRKMTQEEIEHEAEMEAARMRADSPDTKSAKEEGDSKNQSALSNKKAEREESRLESSKMDISNVSAIEKAKSEVDASTVADRMIEVDQQDTCIATNMRVAIQQPGYHVYILNQFAARAHRHDFMS